MARAGKGMALYTKGLFKTGYFFAGEIDAFGKGKGEDFPKKITEKTV